MVGLCIEVYLRSEIKGKQKFAELIDDGQYLLSSDLWERLHNFRKYHNRWVHCDSRDDTKIFDWRKAIENELDEWAYKSITLLFAVLYSHHCVWKWSIIGKKRSVMYITHHGRAHRSHRWGHRFESCCDHHKRTPILIQCRCSFFLRFQVLKMQI